MLILIAMSDSEVNLEQDYEPGRSQEVHGNNSYAAAGVAVDGLCSN